MNNIAAGAPYAGFVVPGHDCGDYESDTFKNNVAHSIDGVGAAVFPNPSSPSHKQCYETSKVSAYKCGREGLWGCFASSMFKATDVTMLDNQLGMVLQV